jgi:hypothetical protein
MSYNNNKKNGNKVFIPDYCRCGRPAGHTKTEPKPDVVMPPKPDDVMPPKPDDVVMPPKPDDVVMPPKPDDVVMPPKPDDVVMPPKPDDVVMPPKPDDVVMSPKGIHNDRVRRILKDNNIINLDNSDNFIAVIEHQRRRFRELFLLLKKYPQIKVIIAGQTNGKHSLGTGIAENAWKNKDHYAKIKHALNVCVNVMKDEFRDRISFGNVGFTHLTSNPFKSLINPSRDIIHVWGANDGNWNTDPHKLGQLGNGQASGFDRYIPGVFGVSTMPASKSEAKNLLVESTYISGY